MKFINTRQTWAQLGWCVYVCIFFCFVLTRQAVFRVVSLLALVSTLSLWWHSNLAVAEDSSHYLIITVFTLCIILTLVTIISNLAAVVQNILCNVQNNLINNEIESLIWQCTLRPVPIKSLHCNHYSRICFVTLTDFVTISTN